MILKEKLKSIAWLRNIVRAIKKYVYMCYRYMRKAMVVIYLCRYPQVSDRKIKVGYIAQISSSWDKIEPVYNAMKTNSAFETYMFVVPKDDFITYEITPDYTNNYFCKKYPDSIKVYDDNGKCIDIANYKLDYIIYQRPYDYRLPRSIRSSRMIRYSRCCYIPYGFMESDIYNNNNIKNEFYDNQHMVFMDSEYMSGLLKKRYFITERLGLRKIQYLGYPALEKYIQWGENEKSEGYITWTPRWSFDSASGKSNFLVYKDLFLNYVIKHPGKYIFRPHPLMAEELIGTNIMTSDMWENYLQCLRENNVIYDVDSPIDDVLRKTEILITDISSIIGNFVMMGRPIIYCDTGVELNAPYREIQKNIYTTQNWESVENICDRLRNGDDYKKKPRMDYVQKESEIIIGASERIVNAIIEDCVYRK